jgi:hypothetical protein
MANNKSILNRMSGSTTCARRSDVSQPLSNPEFMKVFDRELSLRVLQALIRKAGAPESVKLESYSEQDEWADYKGIKVVCEDERLLARALDYLCTLLSRRTQRVMAVRGNRLHASYRVMKAKDPHAIVFARYGIGD